MTLQEFIDRDFAGNVSAFCRSYGIGRATAYRLIEGGSYPQTKLRERLKRKGVHFDKKETVMENTRLILKKKNGSAEWKYYTKVLDLNDFNKRFNDSVSRYFEDAEDIRECENWDEVKEVLDTVESSAQAADFYLLEELEELHDEGADQEKVYRCKSGTHEVRVTIDINGYAEIK